MCVCITSLDISSFFMETFQFRCFIFNFLLKVIRLLGSNRIHLTGLNSQDTKWKVNCNLVKLFHQCHTHTHTHTHTHRHTHTHTDTQLERVRVTSQSENISWSLCVDSRLPRRPLTSFEYECVCVCGSTHSVVPQTEKFVFMSPMSRMYNFINN